VELALPRGASRGAGPLLAGSNGQPAANVTIFLLFFGIVLLDAIRSGNLVAALLWVVLGLVFLRADALEAQDCCRRR
jgi:hypothetical protein